jgi:hypothetical protein
MAADEEPWEVGDAVWVAVFEEPRRPRLSTACRAIVTAVENDDDVTVEAEVPTRTGQRQVVRTVYANELWYGQVPLGEAEDELARRAWPSAEDCCGTAAGPGRPLRGARALFLGPAQASDRSQTRACEYSACATDEIYGT